MLSNNEKGKIGENLVQYKFSTMGCHYVPAPEKTPVIDGYIKFKDPSNNCYLDLAVQVKSGEKKYLMEPKGAKNYIYLRLEPKDILQWQHSNIPVIIVWVQNPCDHDSRILWANSSRAKLSSGKLKISINDELNIKAFPRLLDLAKKHAGRPSIPKLVSIPLYPTKVSDIRTPAKSFYNSWRSEKTISPAFGTVDVTLKGWRHITRNKLSQIDIIHRLSLLPFAKELILTAARSKFVRKLESKSVRRELHVVNGLYKPIHQAAVIVEVVIEVEKTGKKIRKAKLYSVYEKESW